jgi:hypothetical protein
MVGLIRRKESLPTTPAERRQKIIRLHAALEADPEHLTADDFVTRHHFAPGQYAREIELPKGRVVVGKIHRHAHVNVVSKGRVLVFTEGEGVIKIEAPATFVSTPGTKRVVYVLSDAVWTTVHVTNETDLDKIEAEIIAPTYEALTALEHIEDTNE